VISGSFSREDGELNLDSLLVGAGLRWLSSPVRDYYLPLRNIEAYSA